MELDKKNQNALYSKWGWTAELDKWNNLLVEGTLRKESERTVFQIGLNYWTRQVNQSSCGRYPKKRIRTHFVSNGLELLY